MGEEPGWMASHLWPGVYREDHAVLGCLAPKDSLAGIRTALHTNQRRHDKQQGGSYPQAKRGSDSA